MSEHTPGPWRIEPHRGSGVHDRVTSWVIYSDYEDDTHRRDDAIGEIYGPINAGTGDADEREMEANARLVKSLPGMAGKLNRLDEPHRYARKLLGDAEAVLRIHGENVQANLIRAFLDSEESTP